MNPATDRNGNRTDAGCEKGRLAPRSPRWTGNALIPGQPMPPGDQTGNR